MCIYSNSLRDIIFPLSWSLQQTFHFGESLRRFSVRSDSNTFHINLFRHSAAHTLLYGPLASFSYPIFLFYFQAGARSDPLLHPSPLLLLSHLIYLQYTLFLPHPLTLHWPSPSVSTAPRITDLLVFLNCLPVFRVSQYTATHLIYSRPPVSLPCLLYTDFPNSPGIKDLLLFFICTTTASSKCLSNMLLFSLPHHSK